MQPAPIVTPKATPSSNQNQNKAINPTSTMPNSTSKLTSYPSLSAFTVPYKTYISNLTASLPPGILLPYTHIATGVLVFHHSLPVSDPNASPRILLLQRAPHDSFPLHWEVPGGAVDDDDESILAACARELREETGLRAVRVEGVVDAGGRVFFTRSGRRVGKFEFVVSVEGAGGQMPPEVSLDPKEHVDFVWVTERECADGKTTKGDEEVKMVFTNEAQREIVLEGFRLLTGLGTGTATEEESSSATHQGRGENPKRHCE
jgi:8-oxo-dGTP pyrophosphatase MutT (NUDIX family)